MSISQQFTGLPMDQLIGAPLRAATDASVQLAESTEQFINQVAFGKDGKVRNVEFSYLKRNQNDDGTTSLDEMKVDVPMIAIVPVPNLQIDEVNVIFDMEVKESEKSESSLDAGLNASGEGSILGFKVKVSGSVSAHSSNVRSTDNSAKYHVDVRATNHGTPEGLARVLDMMAANIAPTLVNSEVRDSDGKELSGADKERAGKLKQARVEIAMLENKKRVAVDTYDNVVSSIKKFSLAQERIYMATLKTLIDEAADENEKVQIQDTGDQVLASWNDFMSDINNLLPMLDGNKVETSEKAFLFLSLKSLSVLEEKKVAKEVYTDSEVEAANLFTSLKNSVEAQKRVREVDETLAKKRQEYNDLILGINVE